MRFEQLKTVLRSLRFRLTAWNTAVVLVMVVVTLLALREGLRLTLLNEIDVMLLDDTREVASAIESYHPDLSLIENEMDRKVRAHVDRDLFVQLLRPDGTVLWSSRNAPQFEDVDLPDPGETSLERVAKFRVAQTRLAWPNVPEYTIRLGSSVTMIEQDVARLTQLIVFAAVGLLFVAPLGGYWLAGRATQPLARIITATARLRPSHMEERLPIRGTGDELDRLSLTINRFLDQIGDYLERNREFVANAAHELRSPLAAIQSSVEVTLNNRRTIQEYLDLLNEIADQCGQLRVLVNQLLLLAETDGFQSDTKPQQVRLDSLIEKSLDMFRGAAEERGIELTASHAGPIVVEGEPNRLRQVVNNLIDNSLKFTPRGGRVRVALEFDALRQHANLTVADDGCGIDPRDLPHVFERFYRGDKSRHREKTESGNGLGLSICQAIVAGHGGTISVDSAPGRGTTFTVRVPARGEAPDGRHLEAPQEVAPEASVLRR